MTMDRMASTMCLFFQKGRVSLYQILPILILLPPNRYVAHPVHQEDPSENRNGALYGKNLKTHSQLQADQ